MKKSIILSLILISSVTFVQAQVTGGDHRENLEFGAKAGVNYSRVWDERGQDFEADGKMGFAGGLFLSIPVGEFLGFQPEILISQKGFKGSGTLFDAPYSFSRTTTYLDIPLQVQLKPTEFVTVVAGPQYSYLLHRKDSYSFGNTSTAQEQEFENDNIRKNVLGMVGGVDVIVSHLVISARAGWDLQNNDGDGTTSTPRYKNQWLQLTVGLKI